MFTFVTIKNQGTTEFLIVDKDFDWEANREALSRDFAFGMPMYNMVRSTVRNYDNVIIRRIGSWMLYKPEQVVSRRESNELKFLEREMKEINLN